jgi:CheY-like chemotaxis protein
MPLVLVAEDRPTDREFLVALLVSSGYDLIEAATGDEALRMTRERDPDLVIADMLMPEMDGLDLARAIRADIRADGSTAQTPIILYTATYELWELERLARAAGVSLVLQKPTEPRAILAAVGELIETVETG